VRWRREQREQRKGEGQPAPAVPPPVAVAKPVDLSAGQSAIWDLLAPHALAARTLTVATAEAFAMGCRVMVLEREVFALKPGRPDHRMLLVRVEAFLQRFRLSPMGKEMPAVEEPEDAFSEFDQPLTLVKGAK
jgi:hypothetical protein